MYDQTEVSRKAGMPFRPQMYRSETSGKAQITTPLRPFSNICKPLFAYATAGAHPSIVADRRETVMTSALSSWKASRRSLLLGASALDITSLVRTPAQAGVDDQPSNHPQTPPAKREIT